MKATKYILIGVFFLAALAIQAADSLNNTDKSAEQNATAKMPVQSAQDLEIEAIKNEVAEFRKIYEKILDLNAPKKQREQACVETLEKGVNILISLSKIPGGAKGNAAARELVRQVKRIMLMSSCDYAFLQAESEFSAEEKQMIRNFANEDTTYSSRNKHQQNTSAK